MKLIVFVALCGMVALTTAGECGCGALETCLTDMKTKMKSMFNTCGKQCQSKLGDAASAVDACWQNMTATLAPLETSMQSCLLDPSNKLCAAGRRKREDRERRHRRRHHRRCAEDDDECERHWDERWGPLGRKMRPFQDCLMECFHNQTGHSMTEHPEQNGKEGEESHEKRAERQRRPHKSADWWAMGCEKKLNCTIDKSYAETAGKTCFEKSGFSIIQLADVKENSCECLRSAFKISAEAMTCESSQREGVHHHYNGGNNDVHDGSHIN